MRVFFGESDNFFYIYFEKIHAGIVSQCTGSIIGYQ